MLLVLAVIMTTIEGTRVNAGSALSLRALMTSLDSVMAEYYSPLYEDYHVFGLDAGYGTTEIQEDKMISNLNSYMEYTFDPVKDLTEDSINSAFLKMYGMQNILENTNLNGIQNLYAVGIESTAIEKTTSFLEYEGELFEKQVIEYMKYKVPAETVTSFWENTSGLEDTKKSVEILKEKEKTEAKVRELDEIILKLMELTDGITITKNGIKMKSNQIDVKDYFMKKFQVIPISMNSSGVNNEWVFGSLKSHYRDVQGDINGVISNLDTINILNNRIEALHNENISLSQMDTGKMTKEEKTTYYIKVEDTNHQLDNFSKEKNTLINEINSRVKEIKLQIDGVLRVTVEALTVLENSESIQQDVTKNIEDYEELVSLNENEVSREFFNGLKEGVEILTKYKGYDEKPEDRGSYNNYDFSAMKQQLKHNKSILNHVSNLLKISLNNSSDSLLGFRNALSNSVTNMDQYSTKQFTFDYSTLTQPEDSEPFLNEIKNLLQNGIMELVVKDYESISKKELNMDSLPSDSVENNSSAEMDVLALLGNVDLEKGLNLLDNLLSDNLTQTVTDVGEKALSLILYQEYLYDHFGYYYEIKEPEHKALDYELEYILKGNINDADNLSSVVMQILTTRTISNLITLLSDSVKSNEAKLLATSFVGFTGMPLLVETVKIIILTLWAFIESLIDIAALLTDRSVPIYKAGNDIQIKLLEIMGINKSLIHKKALNFKEIKTPLTLKYKDYIGLFLILENREMKLYRTMDLIQENLQLKVADTFYMKNCLTGLSVTGVFHMNSKFVSIPFVNRYLQEGTDGYQYTFTREYTY